MKASLHFFTSCFVLIFLMSSVVCSAQVEYDFSNPSLSIEDRVDDLIDRLTLEEKIGQLQHEAPAVERLGIRNYSWWNECLHGLARNGKATIFPQAIGLGATFDEDLMHRIGKAIALEARAKYNANKATGYMDRYAGLTFWSPNVNLFRDPRWGRGQETYGEDPALISRLGVAFVKGLQGDDELLKVAAMAKHYAVHSGPEKLRHEFDAKVSRSDLWNTYLPAFEALVVEADVEGIMGAYNRTNGEACCASDYLIQDVLRKKWKFDGYFVSDCWALVDLYQGHKLVSTAEEAGALALSKGCNLNCGSTYPALKEAIRLGHTSENVIDQNLKALLPTRFRLGLFDPEGSVVHDSTSTAVVRSKQHINLAYEAAKKSVVLLKNENNTLPLDPGLRNLFVTGPTATDMQVLLANYYGLSGDMRTILEGIVDNVSEHTAVRYVQGALMDRPNVNPMDWYSEEAEVADVTIACLGISQLMEGEEGEAIASPSYGDREYINLPPDQLEFLKLIRSKAKTLIVVVTGGSAISSPEVHEMADAILYAWYPGEQGGQAIGDLLFGKASPSGKLPVSFVYDLEDLPPYEDYNMENRTYRFFQKEYLYPFGFGLNYGDVSINGARSSNTTIGKTNTITINAEFVNNGDHDVEEVVQVYVQLESQKMKNPGGNLKAFKRIKIPANGKANCQFELSHEDFSMYDDTGDLTFDEGTHQVFIGTSSPRQRAITLGAPQWQTIQIQAK